MKGTTIFILVFLVIVIAVVAVSYYFIEKPAVEKGKEVQYNNLSIAAVADGVNVVSNYTLLPSNSSAIKGNTLKDGYVKQSILANQSFSVYIEGSGIYTSKKDYIPTIQSTIRMDIPVDLIGNVTISHSGKFWEDNPLILYIDLNGTIKNPILCFRWSMGIINAEITELNVIDFELPERLNLDRCYFLNKTLTDQKLTYQVVYNKFGDYSDDYLNVVIFDGDITSYSNGLVIYESNTKEDVFMRDLTYQIK